MFNTDFSLIYLPNYFILWLFVSSPTSFFFYPVIGVCLLAGKDSVPPTTQLKLKGKESGEREKQNTHTHRQPANIVYCVCAQSTEI